MRIQIPSRGIMTAAVLAMCGCTITSDGLELRLSAEKRPSEISMEWHGIDAAAGTLTATVSDGRAYAGSYLTITPEAPVEQLGLLWDGWDDSRGWHSWSLETRPAFMKAYDGMVLANLSTMSGDRMRCRFDLLSPLLGMNGGGAGKCQFFGGKTVGAAFSAGRLD